MALWREAPSLRRYESWSDVIAFMRDRAAANSLKDEVLRLILRAHAQDDDFRWRRVLLVIFWPGLMSIAHRKRHWDADDPDELWQRTFWAFHQTVCRIDINRHTSGITRWIYYKTLERLRDNYRLEWKRVKCRQDLESQLIAEMGVSAVGFDIETIVLRDEHERECRCLWRYVHAGVITESDFYLIVGTRMYGLPVSEYARRRGRKPDTVRKQRSRAEAAIRCHDKELP